MRISVVMPTLNSAKHIKYSLDSLANQTFNCFEVIAIDSGSVDGTVDIIRSYNGKRLFVRILFSPDLSPATARNVGIENALGDYIAFCDSDDIMKPDMLNILYKTAEAENADIAVCDFDMKYSERIIENFARLTDEKFEFPQQDRIVDYYYRFCAAPKPNNYVWSRLYRRGFLMDNAIRFPDIRYSEDHLFNLSALLKTPRINHIGQSLYRYIQHDDSAMRKHIRRVNHGVLFLEGFNRASEALADIEPDISRPILAIYAYTRVKSILFYAWQAKLPSVDIQNAVSVFVFDASVKKHLSLCLERGYIGQYCRLHGFSNEWENTVRAMLRACIDNTELPDMNEVFT